MPPTAVAPDSRADGNDKSKQDELDRGDNAGQGGEAEANDQGRRQVPGGGGEDVGGDVEQLGGAHQFFVRYMESRDLHNATEFPPARDGVTAFNYFEYSMDLLRQVMFQCSAQMEVMKQVFMPILRDKVDFDIH